MGPALFVMAILGCGEADNACRQVALAPARYESLDACNAATAAALPGYSDAAFPVVVAQCERADRAAALDIKASDVDLPAADTARPRVLQASYRPVPAGF